MIPLIKINNKNIGIIGVIIYGEIVFDSNFLKQVSYIFSILKELERKTVIIVSFKKNTKLDDACLTFLYIIGVYLLTNEKIDIFIHKELKDKIGNSINHRNNKDYTFIKIQKPKNENSNNNYSLYSEDEYNEIVKRLVDKILEYQIFAHKESTEEFVKTVIGEIVTNAKCHSNEETFYYLQDIIKRKKKNYLLVNIIDYGNTIAGNVNKYFKDNRIIDNDENRINWAIKIGNTTRPGSGGFGLSTLVSYLKKVQGELIIFSGNEICELENGEIATEKLEKQFFPGTIVSLVIPLFWHTELEKDNLGWTGSINLEDI